VSFSEDIQQLELIIRRLEEERMPLEEALSLFRRGTEVLRGCRSFLREASQEIRLLSENDPDDVTGSPWAPESAGSPGRPDPSSPASETSKEEKSERI